MGPAAVVLGSHGMDWEQLHGANIVDLVLPPLPQHVPRRLPVVATTRRRF